MADPDENDGKVVRRPSELEPRKIDDYWLLVVAALTRVFGMASAHAKEAARDLRDRVEDHDRPDTWLQFYHADPFHVAADLADAGRRPITEAEKAAYLEMLRWKGLPR